MRTLPTAVLAIFIVLSLNGCADKDMMEPMQGEMSGMDATVDKTMEDETMMTDAAADPMKPKMQTMDKAAQ